MIAAFVLLVCGATSASSPTGCAAVPMQTLSACARAAIEIQAPRLVAARCIDTATGEVYEGPRRYWDELIASSRGN